MTRKMISCLIIFLGLFCLIPLKADNPREETSFSTNVKFPEEFTVAGINIVSFQPSDVIQVLGKPSEEKNCIDAEDYGEQKRYIFIWTYQDIKITVLLGLIKMNPNPKSLVF
jgi:hypothetical protein